MTNKKSIVLLELIFTIVISAMISIFTMTFLYSLYNKLSNEYKYEINKLELSSTYILLDKIFSNALNIKISENSITFYKEDTKLFKENLYSKFVDLNNTINTKNSFYSPYSKSDKLVGYHITFDDKNFYPIKNDSRQNIILIDNYNKIKIKEHYKIISKNHNITCKNFNIFYNDKILLENVSNCNFINNLSSLSMSFKKDDIPVSWVFDR